VQQERFVLSLELAAAAAAASFFFSSSSSSEQEISISYVRKI
jgi:hypothetical protein